MAYLHEFSPFSLAATQPSIVRWCTGQLSRGRIFVNSWRYFIVWHYSGSSFELWIVTQTICVRHAVMWVWVFFANSTAMRKRGLCCRPVSVRPSVCLSVTFVTFVYPDGWAEDIVKLLSRHGRPIILVFWLRASVPNSKGTTFTGAAKIHGGWKNCNFWLFIKQ